MRLTSTSRRSLVMIVAITSITMGIGTFSLFHSRSAETAKIDATLNLVAQSALDNPTQPLVAALFVVEQSNFDITLVLKATDGHETIVYDSTLKYDHSPTRAEISAAQNQAVRIRGDSPYRLRAIDFPTGDSILMARSTADIDSNFRSNLFTLAAFTLLVDVVALLALLLYFRRVKRSDDVQALSRMQEFLGDASHELRTPLTVIKGYVEMLSKGQLSSTDDQSRAFQRVGSEIKRMESLIQDLLLLAELGESGSRVIENIDFSELVSAHAVDFKTLNSERIIESSIDANIFIVGARDYFARLIQNALTNISRHTEPDVPVKISLTKSGKYALLTIEDGGAGLPESAYGEDIRSLNRFDKSRSRDHGGSGLGMSIMSAVVEKAHGKLSLRKSVLGGLAVVAQLPLSKD